MVRGMTRALALGLPALLGLFVGACQPTLDQTVSIVTTTRVLAVRADPAEVPVMPPTPSTFTALVAGPKGDEPGASTRWAFSVLIRHWLPTALAAARSSGAVSSPMPCSR